MTDIQMVEVIVLVFTLLLVLAGWHRGFLRTVYELIKVAIGIFLVLVLWPIASKVLVVKWKWNTTFVLIATIVIVIIALTVVERVLHIVDHIPVVRVINKLAGAVVGLAQAALIVWLVLAIAGIYPQEEWAKVFNRAATDGWFLPYLSAWNPLLPLADVIKDIIDDISKLSNVRIENV